MIKKLIIDDLIRLLIKAYQTVRSPSVGSNCRFYPSCSMYSILSIRNYGVLKGLLFSIKRIIKCNPWNPGGYDPVEKE